MKLAKVSLLLASLSLSVLGSIYKKTQGSRCIKGWENVTSTHLSAAMDVIPDGKLEFGNLPWHKMNLDIVEDICRSSFRSPEPLYQKSSS